MPRNSVEITTDPNVITEGQRKKSKVTTNLKVNPAHLYDSHAPGAKTETVPAVVKIDTVLDTVVVGVTGRDVATNLVRSAAVCGINRDCFVWTAAEFVDVKLVVCSIAGLRPEATQIWRVTPRRLTAVRHGRENRKCHHTAAHHRKMCLHPIAFGWSGCEVVRERLTYCRPQASWRPAIS
jgi:hypothetical protein